MNQDQRNIIVSLAVVLVLLSAVLFFSQRVYRHGLTLVRVTIVHADYAYTVVESKDGLRDVWANKYGAKGDTFYAWQRVNALFFRNGLYPFVNFWSQ